MKKIAFVVNGITDNGVTKVLSILLDNIDYQNHDVSVVVTRHSRRQRQLNSNARIIEAQNENKDGVIGKISEVCAIRKVIKTGKFDCIIALGNFAAMYTLLGTTGIRTRKIISERNDPNSEPASKMKRKFRDMLYRQADVIVCQTTDASTYYKNIVPRREVIPNPVNSDLPVYIGIRDHRVINFCRIDRQKNLKLLIDSFGVFLKSYPDYRLEIYGNGPLKEEIQRYIVEKDLDEHISMLDFCLDIHEKIKTAAMFVSSSDFEGMSNSMLEAMAIGIPTICTDCPIGGAHEVIESGKNGVLVPVRDQGAMINAMEKFAADQEFADSLARESVKIRDRLSTEKVCTQWWKLIDEK